MVEMETITEVLKSFTVDGSGTAGAEYAVMAGFVAVAVSLSVTALGGDVSFHYESVVWLVN